MTRRRSAPGSNKRSTFFSPPLANRRLKSKLARNFAPLLDASFRRLRKRFSQNPCLPTNFRRRRPASRRFFIVKIGYLAYFLYFYSANKALQKKTQAATKGVVGRLVSRVRLAGLAIKASVRSTFFRRRRKLFPKNFFSGANRPPGVRDDSES